LDLFYKKQKSLCVLKGVGKVRDTFFASFRQWMEPGINIGTCFKNIFIQVGSILLTI